jgi:AcrR family transcriptional regulator
MHRSVDSARVRPGGRTARVGARVLQATIEELVEYGFVALTVESVARRAGVNKATVYRRWGGRPGLLAAAVEAFAAAQADVPNTGDLDEDLRRWSRSVQATLAGRHSGPVVRALFRAAGDDRQLHDLRRRFWLVRLHLALPIVGRALARGELPAGTDAIEVIRHLGAPLYYRLLVLDEPVPVEAADLAAAVTATAARAGVFVTAGELLAAQED